MEECLLRGMQGVCDMEKSVFDLVIDDLVERQKDLKTELRERFKRTKPFRMDPIPRKEMIYKYETKLGGL